MATTDAYGDMAMASALTRMLAIHTWYKTDQAVTTNTSPAVRQDRIKYVVCERWR